MSVFAQKAPAKVPKVEPDPDGSYNVGLFSSFRSDRGKRFCLGDREVAIFVVDNEVHALDAHCYHAGGPLEMGDIEDVGERLCVKCPWHHYIIDLRTGEGIHQPSVAASTACESKGVKQRVHTATVGSDQNVRVALTLEGDINSDYYSSDLYLRLMGKKR